MSTKIKKAIYAHPAQTIQGGKFVTVIENRKVVVMATVGIYSMVRNPGCYPYIADTRKLTFPCPHSRPAKDHE